MNIQPGGKPEFRRPPTPSETAGVRPATTRTASRSLARCAWRTIPAARTQAVRDVRRAGPPADNQVRRGGRERHGKSAAMPLIVSSVMIEAQAQDVVLRFEVAIEEILTASPSAASGRTPLCLG